MDCITLPCHGFVANIAGVLEHEKIMFFAGLELAALPTYHSYFVTFIQYIITNQ